MTTERVEAITKAALALAQHLADCSSEEREAVGQRIADNFQRRQSERSSLPRYGTTPGDGSQGKPASVPLDDAHGFELLQIYLAAAAGDAWQGWPSKGDA
ncbi:hypothetical protein [Luteimonas qiangzhengi]|uniref:hypothetical protein n=1 Tax=Luteimonas sp. MJ146 TaxID=3129240 RepID=UPI0031BA24C5